MKKMIILSFLALCWQFSIAQKAVTTYYDWNKIHPHEKYTVNSAGQKTGPYKEYSTRGVVIAEYNYVNGELNGTCTEYFEKDHNERALKVKATYKNGIKNGPFVEYYGPDILMRQGNFVNGEEEGTWTIVKEFEDYHPKEFEYYKKEVQMKGGKDVTTGPVKLFYYPSGKLFKEMTKENGQVVSDQTMYLPDGKVEYLDKDGHDKKEAEGIAAQQAISEYQNLMATADELFNAKDYPGARKLYVLASKLEEDNKFVNRKQQLIHDAANKVKLIDDIQSDAERKKKQEAEDKHEADSLVKAGDVLFASKDYSKARTTYEAALQLIPENYYATGKIKQIDEVLAAAEKKKQEEMQKQSDEIDTLYERFTEIYHGKKQAALFVDQNSKPIVKDTYPKGEYLYKKTDALLQHLLNEYRAMPAGDLKTSKGKNISSLLDKLISLKEIKTKDIDKEMKDAVTDDDVKRILGV